MIQSTSLESSNLVAKLPGTDPALKDEFVVLSAHIDHVGIGAPINGDSIYNGAMDDPRQSAATAQGLTGAILTGFLGKEPGVGSHQSEVAARLCQ